MMSVNLEDLSKSQQWLLNGYVALHQSSVDRLAATCAGLTISAMAYPALLLRGEVAAWLGGAHGETLGTIAGLLLMFAGFTVLGLLGHQPALGPVDPCQGPVPVRANHPPEDSGVGYRAGWR
ncbi:hypothetical protein ACTXY8_24195 [Pseudomonas aeruginosa]